MIVNENTKIYVGNVKIEKVCQGDEEIYTNYPYSTVLNYIESTGTQYIDTLINGNDLGEYEITLDPLGTLARNYEQYFAGDKNTDNLVPKIFGGTSSDKGFVVQQGNRELSLGTINRGITKVLISQNGVYVNDVLMTDFAYTLSPWGSLSFYVCSSHGEPDLKSSMRLYSLKMWSNGSLVRDFIPVLDKENIPCLYDKVERKLYYNAGTGQFLYG